MVAANVRLHLKSILHTETQNGKTELEAHFGKTSNQAHKHMQSTEESLAEGDTGTHNAAESMELFAALTHRGFIPQTTVQMLMINRPKLLEWGELIGPDVVEAGIQLMHSKSDGKDEDEDEGAVNETDATTGVVASCSHTSKKPSTTRRRGAANKGGATVGEAQLPTQVKADAPKPNRRSWTWPCECWQATWETNSQPKPAGDFHFVSPSLWLKNI